MLLSLATLVACTGLSGPGYKGTQMADYFPLDGDRTSTYYNADTNVGFTLIVEKTFPTERVEGTEIVELEHSKEEDGAVLGAVKWSSEDKILIHGWRSGTDAYTTFDTPVVVADEYMLSGDVETTETNGATYTSTLVGFEACPVTWGVEWDDCAHIKLDDGDGDDSAGPMFAGDYWLVTRYGVAWMKTTGYGEKWDLSNHEYSEDTGR